VLIDRLKDTALQSQGVTLTSVQPVTISFKLKSKLESLLKKITLSSEKIVDYNSDLLINSIIRKTKEFSRRVDEGLFTPESFRTITAVGISSDGLKSINVIDFGGGAGGHFAVAKKAFPEKNLNWLIVETPKMVSFCKEEENFNEITFVSNFDEATEFIPNPGLIIANASIHYTDDPLITLSTICSLGSEWIFLTRTPLTNEKDTLLLLQESSLRKNGPGKALDDSARDAAVVVPIKVPPKRTVENLLSERYQIMLEFEEENLHVNSKNQNIKTYGYLCKLRHQRPDSK
jgi:putative methyltransferase (TIGR04325 family)